MFCFSSLNFFKRIILNTLSGSSSFSISLKGQILELYSSPVMFPWLFVIFVSSCWCLLIWRSWHLFQFLHAGFGRKSFTSHPVQRFRSLSFHQFFLFAYVKIDDFRDFYMLKWRLKTLASKGKCLGFLSNGFLLSMSFSCVWNLFSYILYVSWASFFPWKLHYFV